MSFFSRGYHTLKVPMSMFAENRQRLCARLSPVVKASGKGRRAVVLLQGGEETNRYNTDANDLAFRQESSFFWTFGVMESDFYGIVDVCSGTSVLFAPRMPESYVIWFGKIFANDHWKEKYGVDEVHYVDEFEAVLQRMDIKRVLLLKGQNTDSGNWIKPADIPGLDKFEVDTDTLYPHLVECRVFKSEKELSVIRYACQISSDALKHVMKTAKAGMFEYQLESTFRHYAYYQAGCRHCGYTCISGSGANCAVLHYGHAGAPNDREIRDGELCLLDMGAEYCCYTADITITFPVNGKFSEKQKLIYEAVLAANQSVRDAAKPGVNWMDMHKLAERTLLVHLKEGGLLKGEVDDMMNVRLGAVFMPHGLGHFMGLDVHDVGGYPQGTERSTEPGLKSLRTVRTLEQGMVITVEPGCYFISAVLDQALNNSDQSKFMVKEKIDGYRDFGGVRIEDDIIITASGNENMIKVPRTVAEIEAFMGQT